MFHGLSRPFAATRYHSLAVERDSLPESLEITAWTEDEGDQEIMGIRHEKWPLEGVQFHPESYRTDTGIQILENFLEI